jgi:hypothetical protein
VKATIAGNVIWQVREISGGTGYGSQGGLEAHFGLGGATAVDMLQIEWPSGLVQHLKDVAANQSLTVLEPPRLEVGQGMTPAGFELLLTSRGGYDYRVEASTNLVDWTTVRTLQAVDGTIPVVDAGSPGFDHRFYRAVME